MEAERDLLNYGKYAARLPMAVEKAKKNYDVVLIVKMIKYISGEATVN